MKYNARILIVAMLTIMIFVLCGFGVGYLINSAVEAATFFSDRIIDLSKGDQDLTIYGRDTGVGFSFSMSSGDINGDGTKDLIIGFKDSDGKEGLRGGSGEVDVFFGKRSLPKEIDLKLDNPDVIVWGRDSGDHLGYAVASGDLNGDGFDDLIMTASQGRGPDNNRNDPGEVYIIFGKRLWPQEIDLSDKPGDVVIYGFHQEFGGHLASGDINGDGKDDLLVGNTADNLVHIFYGQDNFPAVIDMAYEVSDSLIKADFRHLPGQDITAGDLNADGMDDLTFSDYRAHGWRSGVREQGEVYVIYGRNPFPSLIDLTIEDPNIRIRGADWMDQVGKSLASGDINGDKIDDLIIGSGEFSEEVFVFFGGPSMRPLVDLASDSADVKILGMDTGDHFGSDIAAGDMDGDGINEIFIGANHANGPSEMRQYCGEVYGISGRTGWPAILDLSIDGPAIVVYGADFDDLLGWTVHAVDLNGDGSSDLIMGALGADGPLNGRSDSGEAYAVLGPELIPAGCSNFDDLDKRLIGATINNEGIRNSLIKKSSSSREAFDRGNLKASGNILCATIHQVEVQRGKHIDPLSAEEIITCVVQLAKNLGIPLDCTNDEDPDEALDEDEDPDLAENIISLRVVKNNEGTLLLWDGGSPPCVVLASSRNGGPFEAMATLHGDSMILPFNSEPLLYFKVRTGF